MIVDNTAASTVKSLEVAFLVIQCSVITCFNDFSDGFGEDNCDYINCNFIINDVIALC